MSLGEPAHMLCKSDGTSRWGLLKLGWRARPLSKALGAS